MSDNILTQRKPPKLIVVMAFDKDEEGNLQPAFGPAEQQSEERAVMLPAPILRTIIRKRPNAIAANPAVGI